MSYLKGPLKRDEIALLMKEQKEAQSLEVETVDTLVNKNKGLESYQNIDASIPQYFEPDASGENSFSSILMAKVKVHFYSQRRGIDEERESILSLVLESRDQNIRWDDAREEVINFENFPHTPPSKAKFQSLPDVIIKDKGLKNVIRELKEYLYQEKFLELLRCASPKLESKVDESRSDFLVRLQDILSDKKEIEIEKIQTRYGKKEKVLTNRLLRAKERVAKESSDSTSSMIAMGISVLGALFGKASPTKIGRAVSKGGRILKERGEMSRAEERVSQVNEELEALEYELEDKIDALNEKYNVDNCEVETFAIKPRKTDIDVENCALVWRV